MFNQILMAGGIGIKPLTDAGGTGTYNVESSFVSAYGRASAQYDIIGLSVNGNRIADLASGLAIDASGLHPSAVLIITLAANVLAKGGAGGAGGGLTTMYVNEPPTPPAYTIFGVTNGGDGENGGSAIKLGCNTTIQGAGLVSAGFGGGGGGSGEVNFSNGNCVSGSGGGGGVPSGAAGAAGVAVATDSIATQGNAGTAANETVLGTGGASASGSGMTGGAGGDGGDFDTVATNGGDGTGAVTSGAAGVKGTDGYTVIKNGKTLVKLGSVTYHGNEAA